MMEDCPDRHPFWPVFIGQVLVFFFFGPAARASLSLFSGVLLRLDFDGVLFPFLDDCSYRERERVLSCAKLFLSPLFLAGLFLSSNEEPAVFLFVSPRLK